MLVEAKSDCQTNPATKKLLFEHGAAIFEVANNAGSYSEFMNMIRWFALIPNDNRYELQGSARMQTIFLLSARMKYGQQPERSRQKSKLEPALNTTSIASDFS